MERKQMLGAVTAVLWMAAGYNSSAGPIPLQTEAAASVTVNFPDAGIYLYSCGNHHGIGMYGAIQVK